ncbi:MAG: ChaN family lipoprotein [Rhodoferax sp.]|nr:ChaN family lipoprotein [Rhodoferax sp.]
MIARYLWVSMVVFFLGGCAVSSQNSGQADPLQDSVHISQLSQLLPADAILLGEQHDAPDHQRIHRLMVETLAARQTLAALALEMASQGQSTEKLGPTADEDQVRAALQWDNTAWPWTAYGPVVMAAVRAGVPVVGANLPPARWREAMTDAGFDRLLSGPALKAQQQNIRLGHCGLLPENQISPMTRIQIARDVSMAQTVTRVALAGKTVLLLAGSGHVDRILGIPQHLPPGFKVKTVLLHAEQASVATNSIAQFDHFWPARPAPVIDYCANLTARQLTQPF